MIAIKGEIDRVGGGGVAGDRQSAARRPAHRRRRWSVNGITRTRGAEAVFPAGVSPAHKYFPPVGRIDGAFGDRNLVCSCPSPEAYA